MKMTFGEAVKLVLSQFGIGALWVQLGIWLGLVLVVLMGFGSIFLSAWGLEWITATVLVFYLIIVIGVIYSPITWSGISGTAILAGQPGGEPNLSLNDGITVLKRWAPIALDKMSLVLIFWVPAWFLYTILFSTKGYVQENMFLFVFIPMLVYFAKDEWPTGKLVLRIAGYFLIAIAVYVVGATVFGTVERKVADPSSVVLLEYQQEQERQTIEREERVAKDLTALKKSGKAFTAEQKVVWEYLERKRMEQSLRPTDLKGKVEQFATEAKPTQSAWWKERWLAIAIGLGVIALVVIGRKKFAGGSGSAGTAHAAPAGGHATTKKGWVGKIIFILLLAGFGYLYLTDRIGYSKTIDVSIADLSDKKVCGLQANTRLVFRPVNPVVVQYGRPNEGFLPIDITSTMRVREAGNPNDTLPGEAFITDSQGCVVVTLDIRESFRKEAVLDRVDQVMAKHPRGVQLRFESAWRPSW